MNKLTMNRRQILGSAAAVSAITALGIKPSQVLGAEDGVLKVQTDIDIQVLDPGYLIGGTESVVINAALPRLADPVKDASGSWTWEPSAAVEKLNQDDDTHISFALKQGLMWSDDLGEITAEDVKFSFERMLKSDWAGNWPTLERVDVTDKYSGTIVLKSPFVAVWMMGIVSESGAIVPKAGIEKLPEGKYTTKFPGQYGPYSMTEWVPKQRVVLKANPTWVGAKPFFPEVHLIDIEDPKAAELAFEAGEVSVVILSPDTAVRYKKSPPPKTKLLEVPGPFYSWVGMNIDHPKLKDIRVRKALQRGVDMNSVLEGAYGGAAPLSHGIVPIGVVGERKKSGYSYNPDEAKALLAEAGVSDLSLDLVVENNTINTAQGQIIQANLADIGVTINLKPLDSGPYWNLGQESQGEDWKDSQMWIMQYRTNPDPASAIQWFVKDQVGVWNWERWSDPEFEELWIKGLAETDIEKRAAIYIRMQDIMEDTGAYIWITHAPLFYGHIETVIPEMDGSGQPMIQNYKGA
jgi:peptide/nickel transport system substrate-binding protein